MSSCQQHFTASLAWETYPFAIGDKIVQVTVANKTRGPSSWPCTLVDHTPKNWCSSSGRSNCRSAGLEGLELAPLTPVTIEGHRQCQSLYSGKFGKTVLFMTYLSGL